MKNNKQEIQQIKIVRITNSKQLQKAFKVGLLQLFQDVFTDHPYYEKFEPATVKRLFISYVKDGILFLAYSQEEVIGFGAAIPLIKSSIAYLQYELTSDPDHSVYMAELGVRKDIRRHGIARQLVQARLNTFPPGTIVIMRTAQNNHASQSLYKSLGFEFHPFSYKVTQLRQDGNESSDNRIFMFKKIY